MALTIALTFDPILPDGMELKAVENVVIPLSGKGAQYNKDITTTDGTFSLASITNLGYIKIKNRAQVVAVTVPVAPVITPQGTLGVTTWNYKIVAVQADGTYSIASAAGVTTTGNSNLDTINFNRLSWSIIPSADHYDIYRTLCGGSPSTTGKIGTTTIASFDDTGLVGDVTAPPTVAADNLVLFGDGTSYQLSLKGQEVLMTRWNAATIHHKASTRTVPVDITLLDN